MPSSKTIWEHIKSTNGKIALVVAFFVGYNELKPVIKDALGFNDDMEEIVYECNLYTDDQIEEQKEEAEKYLDILLADIYRINKRYEKDSIEYAEKHKKFAVGFRSDLNGILSYRDRFGVECATRVNYETGEVEFHNIRKDKWDRCFFEDL